MSARFAPHWQLLSAGWRMSGRWSAFRLLTIGLLVVGLACLAGTTPWVQKPAIRQLFAILSVGTLVILWLLHATMLMHFNHPMDARLVPRQLRCLRTTMLGMWLTLTAAVGVAVALAAGLPFGHSVLTMLLVAACALLLLLWFRWPLLLVPVASVWLATTLFGDGSFLRSVIGALRDLMRPIFLLPAWGITLATLIALLVLARLLTHGVLRAGGDEHAASFRARRLGLREPRANRSYGQILGAFHVTPTLSRRQRAALTPSHAASGSVLQRVVGIRVDPGTGWHVLVPYAIVVLAACSGLWFKSALTATLALGFTCMWTVAVPLVARSVLIAKTAKEHALWMLLPGMPRGTALNHALATRFLKESLVTWGGVAVLSMAPSVFPPTTHPWESTWLSLVVIGLLPSIVFAISDWSRLPLAPTAPQASGGLLWCAAIGPLMCISAFVALGAPVWLLASCSASITAVALGWRWRQLAHYPAALPAGRLR